MQTEKHYEEIGKVVYNRHSRAKNISIRIQPFKNIRVTIPSGVNFEAAEKYVFRKKNWIREKLEKVAEIDKHKRVFTPDTNFSTWRHTLRLKPSNKGDIRIIIDKGYINVLYPRNEDPRSQKVQEACYTGITEALRKEAKLYLPQRVHELADYYGFSVNNIRVKNLKSRWGSCSGANNINLNIHLMRLPGYLLDYVILHELTHTVAKNHSTEFWDLLNNITRNKAKKFDKELKQFQIEFF